MANGKFHGAMMPTTPTGSRVTSTCTPWRTEASSSPWMRSASPAKNLKICPLRATSARPSGVLWLQVGRASAAARTASSVWLRSARAYSATTSRVSDGLVLMPVVVPISHRPLIRCRGLSWRSPSFMERGLCCSCGEVYGRFRYQSNRFLDKIHIVLCILENPSLFSSSSSIHEHLQPLVHPRPPQDAPTAAAGGPGRRGQHPPRRPGAQHDPARCVQAAQGSGGRAGGVAV